MGKDKQPMHNVARTTYDTWYSNNRLTISQGEWKLLPREVLENPEHATQRGLNIISYLTLELQERIDNTLIPQLSPIIGQSGWIIPSANRHITILDIIPHNSDQSTRDTFTHDPRYAAVVQKVFEEPLETIAIEFKGIFASPDGVTLQGFPQGKGLENLRKKLRKAINDAELPNVETNKYLLQTAHVSLVKFVDELDGVGLLAVVDALRDFPVGTMQLTEVVLNVSSQFDKLQTIDVLKRFAPRSNPN